MTRRTEVKKLERGYAVTGWAETEAEAARLQFALVGVPVGEGLPMPVEAEPEWPSDKAAMTYPPNCDGNQGGQVHTHTGQLAEALAERTEGDE